MPQKLKSRLLSLSVCAAALVAASTAFGQSDFIVDGAQPRPAIAPVPARPIDPQRPASRETVQSLPGLGLPLGPGETVDDSALRYYASLNQTQRVQTEMRRLQRLYPGWEAPADLYDQSKTGGEDEQAFWDLFAADQLDDLRAAIDQRGRSEPGWNPSAELTQKLARKTQRNRILGLFNSGRLQDLLDTLKKDNFNSEDADVDVLWAIAEAYAKTKQTQDALQTYKSILTMNRESDVRLATIQKAMATLRTSDVEQLIAMGKNDEFARMQTDVTRMRISAYLHDERRDEVPAPELKTFEDYARSASDPNQAGLVAWYYYKAKAFREALEWFKLALERGGDAMIAHGLAHSLRELGMYRETEEVAYAWRQPLINNAILFIDILERDLTKEVPPYIEPERLLRYAQVTMDIGSGEGAQALAWYAYNSCQFDTAYEWFSRAAAWFPKEGTVYGLAVSARRTKRMKEYVELINRYDGLFPKVIELVFPDGVRKPPTSCDLQSASPKQRQQMLNGYYAAQSSFAGQQTMYLGQAAPRTTGPGPGAGPGGLRPGYNGGSVQQFTPMQQGYGSWQTAAPPMPKLNPQEFPVAIGPENPLRFASSGKWFGKPMPIAASGTMALTPMATEYYRGPYPLVARRVPGVGPMPYERYGFALLPGWNGITTASEPRNAEKAPEGTIWTTQQAEDALATRGTSQGAGGDALRQDLEGIANMLGQLPRVPPPAAVMGGNLGGMTPFTPAQPQPTMQQFQPGGGRRSQIDRTPTGSGGITRIARSSATDASSPAARTLSLLAFLKPRPIDPDALPAAPARAPQAKATDDAGREAVARYNDQHYSAALAALDRRARSLPEPLDLRLVRGWSLLNLGRLGEARQVFDNLNTPAPVASAEFIVTAPIAEEGH
ncbi:MULTISPECIES: hypothetical protein [unclassified Beijerinckia]|uniref:tetratricopeptide repeat protein n=1 Tax=unclassified Beijerinckia TaxID=2638183 RepID=UPI000898BA14|nr:MULTISPECIES: hypothetical protein [unclassified Beijerinckia]MDH7798191.1 tetratricopeptide (TPR) repeat protein [Beijerinckia sp. GAS462]SED12302.1 Tetratricopeptide repeat-containing protein [Beijerinckia sp. 28-YEA-48]